MTPSQIKEWVTSQVTHLPRRARREAKPDDVKLSVWKNRHRVSVKLKPELYQQLDEFSVLTGLNDNESLNFILSAFFNG